MEPQAVKNSVKIIIAEQTMSGALTRILNNQITNSTIIASQKIAAGTITGSLFSSNVTVPGDFLITGNLFVLGTSAYTTVASTNTYVNDPLITLNNGFSGTNTYDEGFVFNRGSSQNRAFVWSEYYQEFRLIGTTETGTAYGNVAVSNYQNLHIGNLTVDYAISTGSLNTTGFINTSGNISGAVGNFGSINSTGLINTTGNVVAATVLATLHIGTSGTFGNVASGFIGNTGTAFTGASINLSGNVLASTVLASYLTASTATVGNISAVTIGNTGATITGTTGAFSGNVIGGLAQFAAINNTVIGNSSPAAGTFTTLNATGNVLGAAATFSSAQINGNENVTGYLNVTGNILGSAGTLNTLTLNSTTNATDATSGALQIAGGVGISKDVWIGGNLYVSNIFATSYNILTVNDPLLYLTAANTYPYTYDIGFYSQFVGTSSSNPGAANIYQHSGVVRDHNDGYWKLFSNVVTEPTGTITFDATTKYDGIKAGNLILADATASTTTGTGALVVTGGAGIAGAVTAGSFNTAGNVNAATVLATLVQATSGTFGNVASGFIGNTGTAFTGASINLSGNVLAAAGVLNALTVNGGITSTGYINTSANISGAIINTGTLNAATLTATGNVIGGLASFASINNTPIGNATASTGAFTTLSASAGIWANSTTDTTSLTTGALIVAGGAAIGKTAWIGEGLTINSTQSAEQLLFKGQGNAGLIVADAAKNAITFSSTGNASVQSGVIAKFDSTGAIILPTGATASRPGSAGNVDIQGMLRYNTTINNMEFYDGSAWQTAGSTFTVISDRQFSGNTAGGYGNVDGTNTAFTLQANSTTAGTIVSINGVMQFPTLAYSVSGSTLTFTEPPAPDDVIDARIIVTTSQVTSLASANGYNQFVVDATGSSIWSGTSVSTERLLVDTGGNINVLGGSKITYDQTAIQLTNTNLTLLDSFGANTYTTSKYIVSIKQGTGNVQAMEALVTTNGLNAWITTYGVTNTGNNMGSLSANVDAGVCSLWFTPLSGTAISNVKVQTTYIV